MTLLSLRTYPLTSLNEVISGRNVIYLLLFLRGSFFY